MNSRWLRLYIVVEGETEKVFADLALKPHLEKFNIEVKPRVVITNRKLDKRGGILSFRALAGDLQRLMRQDQQSDARFTTMIDFYGLPGDFPGWEDASRLSGNSNRVQKLESKMQSFLGDSRFIPYIQLHEFETLLYCDLSQLESRLSGASKGLNALRKNVSGLDPEDINDGVPTAPSKRLIEHVPVYRKSKVRVGGPAAATCAKGEVSPL